MLKVLALNGISFQYKKSDPTQASKQRFGLIAQEVEPIIPEAIKDLPDGTKAISYSDIVAVLIEALKEQQIMIDSLASEIELIRNKQ